MKKLFACFAAVLACAAAPLAHAAEFTMDDLPPSIVMVSVGAEMMSPGNHPMLAFTRAGKEYSVIFRSQETFAAFAHTLPPDRSKTLFTMQVPGSTVAPLVEHDMLVLVDPASEAEGGIVLAKKAVPTTDNAELTALYQADQSDREPANGKPIDWSVVTPRDKERLKRVIELFNSGAISTGSDFGHAAFIMQHGSKPEDFLMAHDFGIAALKRGKTDATWIIAASEDRFLENIGRKQRYGTQLSQHIETDGALTDDFRQAMGVPKLAESMDQARNLPPH